MKVILPCLGRYYRARYLFLLVSWMGKDSFSTGIRNELTPSIISQ